MNNRFSFLVEFDAGVWFSMREEQRKYWLEELKETISEEVNVLEVQENPVGYWEGL